MTEKDKVNGVTRPKAGTKTGYVWEVADANVSSDGEPPARKDVIKVCEGAGVNIATASTQYGRWLKYNGYSEKRKSAVDESTEDSTIEETEDPVAERSTPPQIPGVHV